MTPASEAAVYPVILKVSKEEYHRLSLKERVRYLSAFARDALMRSAGLHGTTIAPELLEKDRSTGRPLPLPDGYWSLSHKPGYVAGVFSPEPVGIDIERNRPYNARLRPKVAGADEWLLADSEATLTFFRYWTAKEAVLKIAGIGIADLLKCRVVRVIDRRRMLLRYRQKDFHVAHAYVGDHVAAVVKGIFPIRWVLPEDHGQ